MLAAAVERPGQPARWDRTPASWPGSRAAGVPIAGELPAAGVADVWIDFSSPARPDRRHARPPPTGARRWWWAPPASATDKRALRRRRGPAASRWCYAPNMSVGVNVLLKLVADAARALGPDYDLEIVETHHRAQARRPSGTALRLAEALAEATGRDLGDDRALHPPRRRRPAHRRARSAFRPCAAATSSATTPSSFWATASASRSPTAPLRATRSRAAPCAPPCGWRAARPASTTCATCSASDCSGVASGGLPSPRPSPAKRERRVPFMNDPATRRLSRTSS